MSTPWPTTSIGELFDIGAGKSVTPASRGQEPKRPFLRTSNVLWGRFDLTDVDTMFFTDEEFAAKNLRSGDLLVCEGGDIGRAAVWQGQLAKCSFQNHLHRLRPKRPDIIPEFYQFALEGGITLFGLIEGVGNRTTIPNLSRNRLAELAVPLPPIDEQRKIAAVLGKVQAAVAVEGDLVRVARELKQAALRQLFTRGLRHEPQKQTALGPVPESWAVAEAGSLCHFSSGGTPDRGNQAYWTGGTIPWVKTGEVNYRTIAAETARAASGLAAGPFGVYWELKREGYPEDRAKALALEIEEAHLRFPNADANPDELRQLKAEIYKVLLKIVSGKKMIDLAEVLMRARLQ